MDKDVSQLDPITYNNDYAGSWTMNKKKKMVYEDELLSDTDNDGPDSVERAMGIHDKHNRHIHNHLNIGGALKMGKGGMVVPHDMLTPLRKNKGGFKLTITSPKPMLMKMHTPEKPMKYTIDLKAPDMRKVKMKTSLDDKKIKMPKFSIGDNFINQHKMKLLDKIHKRKRKVK